jgi:hypothetical protein
MSDTSVHPAWTPACAVCDRPVTLETCKVDEHGRPVHDECYCRTTRPTQAAPQSRQGVIQLPSFLGHYRV